MHRNLLIFCATLLIVGSIIALNITSVQSQSDRVQRGKYLVDTVGACGHCHTPALVLNITWICISLDIRRTRRIHATISA